MGVLFNAEVLQLKENVDILKYGKMISFLKRKIEGYIVNKAKTFIKAEMAAIINEARNTEWLAV